MQEKKMFLLLRDMTFLSFKYKFLRTWHMRFKLDFYFLNNRHSGCHRHHYHCMEKNSLDILLNFSFCFPHKKESHTILDLSK